MKNNKGFTLIEIGIVLFVVGILVAVFIPSFTQRMKDKATAAKLIKTAEDMNKFWVVVAQQCNLSFDNAISQVPASGKNYYNVFNDGVSSVATSYRTCFRSSNVKANNSIRIVAGQYFIDKVVIAVMPTTFRNRTILCLQMMAVSSSLGLELLNSYARLNASAFNSSLTSMSASNQWWIWIHSDPSVNQLTYRPFPY